MRDILAKSLEILIWTVTAVMVFASLYLGALTMRLNFLFNLLKSEAADIPDLYVVVSWIPNPVVLGIIIIIFGTTSAFVFAGICFQVMDIRSFTKHAAISLKKFR